MPVSEANGRATLVSSQEKGPFNIDLSIIPGRAVVPSTHVSVLIRSVEDDAIVTDAEVLLWATGPAGSTGLGPIPAVNMALERANWKIEDIDLFEINEAFASQSIAVIKNLKIQNEIVNVNGGAIALGHPIGASGTRILVPLIHEMIKQNKSKGCATLCIGGGMGIAICIERS